jgi:hypothetical protein
MATIRRRGATWQVQVRRQGHTTLSRTFRLKADAEQWARQKEAEIDRGELPVDTRVLRSHTLAQLLERYSTTVVPRKRSADRERYMLRVVLRHPIACLSLHRLTPAEIARYRDDRLEMVSGDTVRRELAVVRHCLEVARHEWGFALPVNPVRQVKLPRPSNPRERRVTATELQRLLAAGEATRLSLASCGDPIGAGDRDAAQRIAGHALGRRGHGGSHGALAKYQEWPSANRAALATSPGSHPGYAASLVRPCSLCQQMPSGLLGSA